MKAVPEGVPCRFGIRGAILGDDAQAMPMNQPLADSPGRYSVAEWNAAASSAFGEIDIAPTTSDQFIGSISQRIAKRLSLTAVQSTPSAVAGASRHGDLRPGHFVLFNASGRSLVGQADWYVELGEGDIVAIRSDHSYDIRFDSPNRMVVVHVPANLRGVDWDMSRLDRGNGPSSTVLSTTVRQWSDTDPDSGYRFRETYARMIYDALTLAWPYDSSRNNNAGSATAMEAWGERVAAFVSNNLDQPDLSSARVGAALGASARYIQLVMANQGTSMSQYVINERLDRAADLLLSDSSHSVTDVAFMSGFRDLSHFCRVFKARFGLSASQWRRHAMDYSVSSTRSFLDN
ncbi:helix-turn-helix domain-containing protein [Mycolicibacterium neoaurum]|uniref:helix-turn-helix domain-containing protein n=1 Tax=Mycolicibacterium neoaurum TaxID=1795 RepID=UPI001BD18684|nr:helix-turn-helix domain-containing protein [Mycolicibacterium neoaurum]QVI27273.1 helix-turn-helix domain-containing protein [Mycolicibacterium neoaurum]